MIFLISTHHFQAVFTTINATNTLKTPIFGLKIAKIVVFDLKHPENHIIPSTVSTHGTIIIFLI